LIEVNYNKSIWTLDSYTGDYALLTMNKDAGQACVIRCVDGDWENNDTGTLEAMRRKFMRVTGKTFPQGLGRDSFDAAYPIGEWAQTSALFLDGFDYYLWKGGPNPKRPLGVCMRVTQHSFRWEVLDQGEYSTVHHTMTGFKATVGAEPIEWTHVGGPPQHRCTCSVCADGREAEATRTYAGNPNFGRF
jgi:hypothetical protein